MPHRSIWIAIALGAAILLVVLFFGDYPWVNLIHSGSAHVR